MKKSHRFALFTLPLAICACAATQTGTEVPAATESEIAGNEVAAVEDEPASDEPLVHGPIDRNVIRRVILTARSRIRYCYDQALGADPEVAGRVTMEFTIELDGSVGSAEVRDNDTGNDDLAACVRDAILGLRFPPLDATTVEDRVLVTYPFQFAPPTDE